MKMVFIDEIPRRHRQIQDNNVYYTCIEYPTIIVFFEIVNDKDEGNYLVCFLSLARYITFSNNGHSFNEEEISLESRKYCGGKNDAFETLHQVFLTIFFRVAYFDNLCVFTRCPPNV